jgi:hypothetical protein
MTLVMTHLARVSVVGPGKDAIIAVEAGPVTGVFLIAVEV